MKVAFLKKRIADLISVGEAELKTGPFGTQLKASEYTEEGTPVINVRNIGMGNMKPDKLEFISNTTRDRLSSHLLQEGDIVFGRKGAVERHVFIRSDQNGWFQGSDCLRLRFKSPLVEPLFASYFFLTEEHQRWMMNQCSHGATMSSLNQEILERIELPLPPLPVQRRIAGILSAYDDLIENNQRRIKILEAMARALYREWFVHFRFPGHENHPRVASPLGDIPKGWELAKLGDVCKIIPGYAFKSKDWQSAGIPVIKIKNIQQDNTVDTENTDFVSDEVFHYTHPKFVLGHGDILIAMTGATAGKIGKLRVKNPFLLNQRVAKILPEDVYTSFVWCAISSNAAQENFFRLADGAAQPNMSGSQIESVEIICPPREIVDFFSKLAEPILRQTDILHLNIQNLRRTRDLLLPRLLSGQVDAEAL